MNQEQSIEINEVITLLAQAREREGKARDARIALEYEVLRLMQAREATTVAHPDYGLVKVKKGRPTYDTGILLPLLENADIPQVMIDKAYIPEHQETVAAKWDGRGLNEIAKLGGDIAETIESATIRAADSIVIGDK